LRDPSSESLSETTTPFAFVPSPAYFDPLWHWPHDLEEQQQQQAVEPPAVMCLIRVQKAANAAPLPLEGRKRARPASSSSGPSPKKAKTLETIAPAVAPVVAPKPKSIVEAARLGDVASIQEFLDVGEDVNQTSLGSTALHYAVFYNHFESARLLIDNYADIDAQNDLGLTPLHWAVDRGHTAVVKLLLEHGASLEIPDRLGFSVLHKAVLSGNLEILSHILALANTNVALAAGAANGEENDEDSDGDRLNINTRTYDEGLSPLHQAALMGRTEIVAALVAHPSCDVNIENHRGSTPLHKAASKGFPAIVRLLLDHGANVDAVDSSERTPLHWACFYGHTEVARVLLLFGPAIEITDKTGLTASDLASQRGNFQIQSCIETYESSISSSSSSSSFPGLGASQTFDEAPLCLTASTCSLLGL